MRRTYTAAKLLLSVLPFVLSTPVLAQAPNPTQSAEPARDGDIPVFRVTATARATRAVNFNHRDGSTVMNLVGTGLMPKAKGEVKVDSKTGATKIDAVFDKLEPAQTHGDSFLTYVMWAITPDGRPENLGEVMLSGNDARLQSATNLQTFGLIVTAEPYFAVTQPSDIVVMEAEVKPGSQGTEGTFTIINAKYDLLDHGSYDAVLPPADRALVKQKNDIPLDLKEARHAMAIARGVGAESHARDTMQRASNDLLNAESIWTSRQDKKRVQTLARNVTQLAEDARIVTLREQEQARLAKERADAESKVAAATTEADRQTNLRLLAETQKREADERAAQAKETAQREATLRSWSESQRIELAEARAEADRVLQQTRVELNQTREQNQVANAELVRQRAAATEAQSMAERTRAEADAAKAATAQALLAKNSTEQEKLAAEARAREAEDARKKSDAERAELRIKIMTQLNKVLQTKDTARGLIVNVSDVLFESGKYTLKPGAREKLAKVAGVLETYPDLKITIEGHTDSVGSDELNQKLSENRANEVKKYLTGEGVPADAVSSIGFGKTRPVASNANAAGRQQNRRVELVVAGESIQAAN